MTKLLSNEDIKESLDSLKHDFLNYQKRSTPILLFVVVFFGVFLVRLLRMISVIAAWLLLMISILILTYWLVKYFVYTNAIKTVSLTAIHMLQADMMLKFKEKKIPTLPFGGDMQESFSTIIDTKNAVLVYLIFLVVVLLNYVLF